MLLSGNLEGMAQALAQQRGQGRDHQIARGMAVGVVHRLEVVDVDHGKTQGARSAPSPGDCVFQQLRGG